jgi:hypothetical protein
MFAQIIRGKTSDPSAVRAALDKWIRDLEPHAKGYLGTTSGVTAQGDLFALVRFESEEAAKANSDRPEQGEWWAEMAKTIDGEAVFQDSSDVTIEENGDLNSAGFVQVMSGQVTDSDRAKQLMADQPDMRELRPDVLGSVLVGGEGGEWTMVIYFTSEAEAREGEKKEMPPEIAATMQEIQSLAIGETEFLDLRTLWLDSPK